MFQLDLVLHLPAYEVGEGRARKAGGDKDNGSRVARSHAITVT